MWFRLKGFLWEIKPQFMAAVFYLGRASNSLNCSPAVAPIHFTYDQFAPDLKIQRIIVGGKLKAVPFGISFL